MRHLKVVANCALLLMLCLGAGSLLPRSHAQSQRPTPAPVKFDEFKYTDDDRDQEAHLARFAAELKRQPRLRGYIIGYGKRLFRYGDLSPRQIAGYAKLDLVYVRNDRIDWDRIVTIDGGHREERMIELYLVPPGALPPAPGKTLPPGEVTFCPNVYVWTPDYIWDASRPLEFGATVREEKTKIKPTFKWTISNGTITSGQGTSKITVRPSGSQYQPVVAAVEIGGYAPACAAQASASSPEKLTLMPFRVDEFGDINCEDEWARLDNYAVHLQTYPDIQGYIIFYGGRRYGKQPGKRDQARARSRRLKEYLVNVRGMEAPRLSVMDGGYREEWTAELWLNPRGAPPPVPTPTVRPDEIKFRPGRMRKGAYGCGEIG
jgi:hypothetical protein